MTRTLGIALLTLGDPARLTGGYLYHRRMEQAAPRHAARIEFLSLPDRPFPVAILDAPGLLRCVGLRDTDVLVLDSIAAAFLAPWLAPRRLPVPLVAMLHQPPGGIDHGPVREALQALLDRRAYRRATRLLAASDSLVTELVQ
jgi:hypothetical protein